jgi:hypothetical protein
MKTFVIVFLSGLLCSTAALAQLLKPDLPILSFGVREGGSIYTRGADIDPENWWPDNRIWTVPSRVISDGNNTLWNEVLVPVFIQNTWFNVNKVAGLEFEEISSFTFRVYFDNQVLQFVDVVKHHPYTREEAENLQNTRYYASNIGLAYIEPLAKEFTLSTSVENVSDYFGYFNVNAKRQGSRVTVSGIASSFKNLDTARGNKVLVYLKFRVLATQNTPLGQNRLSKLYFDPTYILYNGINITKDKGLKLLKDFPLNIATQSWFANPAAITGTNDNLDYYNPSINITEQYNQMQAKSIGIQNDYQNFITPERYNADPYLPGSIDLRVMNDRPNFIFDVVNPNQIPQEAQIALVEDNDPSTWKLTVPIIADSLHGKPTLNYNMRAERAIDVSISRNEKCTMEDIIIETDQPWLRVRSTPLPDTLFESKFGTNTPIRRIFVQRINQLIDANSNDYNPFEADELVDVNKPRKFRLYADCDRTGLIPGEYFGYITLKSAFDKYEPTRILVRFVVLDNPTEHANAVPTGVVTPFGITLKVTPFNGLRTDLTKTIIMGSAPLATTSVDTLFGEFPYNNGLGFDRLGNSITFDARFFLDTTHYPRPTATADVPTWLSLARNGFGDMAHFDGMPNGTADDKQPRSNSRDIRSSLPSNSSHIFYVKYEYLNGKSEDFYPVILQWDAKQFNNTANTIFLKYMDNGALYVRDMRNEGTSIGSDMYQFAFNDKQVKEFWIEYTVGEEQANDLVDNFGDPMIMPNAWNFVSLPLNPINKDYKYIFSNALNKPYYFSLNQWQETDMLQPGIGYFLKYQNVVDKKFFGAYFDRINSGNFPVRLYSGDQATGGWNAIGALSVPVSIDRIGFDTYLSEVANPDYTLQNGVWAYRPKNGYAEVASLLPGKAYWIKVDKNSYLNVSRAKSIASVPNAINNRTNGFDMINISDAIQNSANLYAANNVDANNFQLPPAPPAGMFDVRFAQDNFATDYATTLVKMQGVSYPVVVNFSNPRANYSVIDPVSGYVYGDVKAGVASNVVIDNSKSNSFKLVIEGSNESFFVTVNQNPITTNYAEVTFGINNNDNVNLAIFNALGNEVANFNAGTLNSGVYNHTFDVSSLPTGSYTVRLTTGSDAKIFRMNVVK